MLELSEKRAYRKIIQTGRLAEKLGADILGLGAFTSVVGDGGITIAKALDIPVTTGDAYTVSIALQALEKAAGLMGISTPDAAAAVVGATGAIGRICAEILAEKVSTLYLIGRDRKRLEDLKSQIGRTATGRLEISTEMEPLKNTALVMTVSSAIGAIIQPQHLRPGSVVCDVARPRDVAAQVAHSRKDVFVFDGGIVDVPGEANFNFDFGFPPGKAYACMAETIALALENRLEDYTVGKNIARRQVDEITAIAHRHGFRLSGFRSFEKPVSSEQIRRVRELADRKSSH